MIVLYIILAIVILLVMVLIHEFGHYVVGRALGFKITEFSVGFGKAIVQKPISVVKKFHLEFSRLAVTVLSLAKIRKTIRKTQTQILS